VLAVQPGSASSCSRSQRRQRPPPPARDADAADQGAPTCSNVATRQSPCTASSSHRRRSRTCRPRIRPRSRGMLPLPLSLPPALLLKIPPACRGGGAPHGWRQQEAGVVQLRRRPPAPSASTSASRSLPLSVRKVVPTLTSKKRWDLSLDGR
jgi:hypothetical protein